MNNHRNPIDTARTIEPTLEADFTNGEIASLAGLGNLVEFPTGTPLIAQGTPGTFAYFIISGSATVDRDGVEVATLTAGDLAGEQAIVTGRPRNATVIAAEPVQALQLDQRAFRWLRLESTKVKQLSNELIASRG